MTDTFVPPLAPVLGRMPQSVTPRVLSANFGDGYRQDGGDGLNVLERKMDVTWEALSPSQADDIEDFFSARKGYIAFLWTPSGGSIERKWVCRSWTRNPVQYHIETISANFEMVFDL